MIENGIKAICLDYYGTLVDIGKPFDKIKKWSSDYIKLHAADISIDKFFARFTKNRACIAAAQSFALGYEVLSESFKRTCMYYGVPCMMDEFMDFIRCIFTSPKAYEDSHYAIDILKKKYLVGLLSNADNCILYDSIRKQGFDFDFVVTSEDARCYKPHRGIFEYAKSVLQLELAQMLMIGDSETEDIYGAFNVGMDALWICKNNEFSGVNRNVKIINTLSDILQMT